MISWPGRVGPTGERGPGPRLGRVAAAILIGVGLLVVLGGYFVAHSNAVAHHSQSTLTNRDDPALDDADALLTAFLEEQSGVRGLLITGQTAFLEPFTAAAPQISVRLARLTQLTKSDPSLHDDLASVITAHNTWLAQGATPEQAAVAVGRLQAGRDIESTDIPQQDFDALHTATTNLSVSLRAIRMRDEATNAHDQTAVLVDGSAAGFIALVVLGGLGLLLRRGVLRPLGELSRAAQGAALDPNHAPLPVGGPPEIRAVAAATERMRADLVRQLELAREAREALEQRGQAVLALQRELTPTLTPVPGLAVSARLHAAEGLLAGDWYDQVALDDGRVAFVVGDVSGHGAAAGAYALSLARQLRASLATGMTPGQALGHVAGLLDESVADERFASVFILVIDIRAGTAVYANAGHPDALLVAADGSAQSLPPTGPLLATITATPTAWATLPLTVTDGALLLAVTDGLLESRDATGEEFGPDRLLAETLSVVASARAAERVLAPDDVLDAIFDAVGQFGTVVRNDDRTALAVVCHAGTPSEDVRAGS